MNDTPNQQADTATRPVTSSRRRGTPAAERKRQQRQRERQSLVYETTDWRLFTSWETLSQKAGCHPSQLGAIVLKELVDNALDAGAEVTLTYADSCWVVLDNGPGLDREEVPQLFAVNRPLRSSKLRRLPIRGMLGNGLRVVLGAVAANNSSLIVETRGHRLTLTVCQQTGQTVVQCDEPIPMAPGLTVRLFVSLNGERDAHLARESIALAKLGKTYAGPSSPWWYGPKDLHRLFTDVTPADTTVASICRSLGLRSDDDRQARALSLQDAADVLERLRSHYPPVSPAELGCLGSNVRPGWRHYDGIVSYAGRMGTAITQSGAQVPYVVEAWAGCSKPIQKSYSSVNITTVINRSVTVANLHASSSPNYIYLSGCGLQRSVKGQRAGSYLIYLSIISPYIQLATDGKEPSLAPFSEAIAEAIRKACSAAYRYMDRPERTFSIKDAAWSVMDEAYRIASANGTLPANARQIMYAARGEILRLTGKTKLDDAYFTQTLLPNYVEEKSKDYWDVVFDARGNFNEPHTAREVRLGTIDVREYLGDQPVISPSVRLDRDELYPTKGPRHRYSAVLFIEKEGFDSLLRATRISERFDIAVMSTKGMSTTAARLLLDRLAPDVDKILVTHDFDVAGFSIFGTLHTDGRRYKFKNELPIVDIGLRLADIEAMDLQAEPVETSGSWASRSQTLSEHGATEGEIAFLETQRVELNAMPSDVFISFLERKLAENGVCKVVPGIHVLEHHARRMIEQQLADDVLRDSRDDIQAKAASALLPDDLEGRVRLTLKHAPTLSWDQAVSVVVCDGDRI